MFDPDEPEVEPPTSHRLTSPRAEKIAIGAAVGVVVLGALLALLYLAYRGQQGEIHAKSAQVNAAVGAATSANASLSAAGLPTVQVPTSAAAPTSTVTVTGPIGETGPGPSDAQVSAAVVTYCNTHVCSSPPSSSDVASAVAAYCVTHAACEGPAGPSGAQGQAGQNASTDQIAAAVQSYCSANNGCQGPSGAQGASGPEIPSFTFTFTDELGHSTTYECSAPDYQCEAQ